MDGDGFGFGPGDADAGLGPGQGTGFGTQNDGVSNDASDSAGIDAATAALGAPAPAPSPTSQRESARRGVEVGRRSSMDTMSAYDMNREMDAYSALASGNLEQATTAAQGLSSAQIEASDILGAGVDAYGKTNANMFGKAFQVGLDQLGPFGALANSALNNMKEREAREAFGISRSNTQLAKDIGKDALANIALGKVGGLVGGLAGRGVASITGNNVIGQGVGLLASRATKGAIKGAFNGDIEVTNKDISTNDNADSGLLSSAISKPPSDTRRDPYQMQSAAPDTRLANFTNGFDEAEQALRTV
ncbi:hypothetical protein [Neptunomonas sp. XY-337]|uniref:hypothetical protein n=1 Tax=Neptunomonas sp. XY-337 TaxID=2561897 RepID=UPI0010AA9396|nr:hypothetical protein [Neptunomonas sp. XY-337]